MEERLQTMQLDFDKLQVESLRLPGYYYYYHNWNVLATSGLLSHAEILCLDAQDRFHSKESNPADLLLIGELQRACDVKDASYRKLSGTLRCSSRSTHCCVSRSAATSCTPT